MQWAQVSTNVFDNVGRSGLSCLASRISMTHLGALHILTGSWAKQVFCLSALEMLGLSYRLLMFLMGKRISSMVMVFSLKSSTVPRSCKVCLPMIRSYNSDVPPRGYHTQLYLGTGAPFY